MLSKKKLAKELAILSKEFLNHEKRKVLLASLRGEKTIWFSWTSRTKNILRRLDRADAIKFSGFVLLLEQGPDNGSYQDSMKKFLVDRVEYYKYYDFDLERELNKGADKNWRNKVLRLFISRSFLGIVIVVLILGFIAWFYIDRESCLEFVSKVVQPFLKAIR